MPKKKATNRLQARIAALVAPDGQDTIVDIEEDSVVTKAKLAGEGSDGEEGGSDLGSADLDYDFAQEASSLRRRTAPSLARLDPKYKGRKTTRQALMKAQGSTSVCPDEKEHEQADWGHMFEPRSGGFEVEDETSSEEDDEEAWTGEEFTLDEPQEDSTQATKGGPKATIPEVVDEEDEEDEEFTLDEPQEDSTQTTKGGPKATIPRIVDEDDDVEDDDVEASEFTFDEDMDLGHMIDDDEGSEEGNAASPDEAEEDEADVVAQSLPAREIHKELAQGQAIQRQLKVWESLLEVRIQLQKALGKVNQFPQPATWSEFQKQGDAQYHQTLAESQANLAGVMADMMGLEDELLAGDPEVPQALKRPHTEAEAAEPEAKAAKTDQDLGRRFEELLPYRNAVIQKWNDKTQLASGVVKSKSFAGFETSTLKQIEHILTDQSRLIKRTQVQRSAYRVLGEKPTEGEETQGLASTNEEIFDDDDFYHQLLKEFIDRKTSNVTDPDQLGRHWIQIQKMRSKMKRKVDTKASKGRKTRYDIHAKLTGRKKGKEPLKCMSVHEKEGNKFP
eukprot:snap_masked-scaffold130_size324016-processed-gene-2.0 protein:Tk07110 transcript:snap_masked-scaffold130_size324016-processed-gene-2.0-mRNA-1 annotation:"protein aatf"